MKEILFELFLLSILVISNIALGTWFNVKVQDVKFDWKVLLNGIYKGSIIACVMVGLTYVFMNKPELTEAVGVSPIAIMNLSIIGYAILVVAKIEKILGIKRKGV